MQCTARSMHASRRVAGVPARSSRPQLRLGRVQSQSGRAAEPFNEGAVQVKRLVNRDRKELLGNKVDILDKYVTEFGDPDDDEQPAPTPAPAPASSSSSSPPAAPAAAAAAPAAAPSRSPTAAASAAAAAAAAAAPTPVATKFTGSSSMSSPFGGAARTRSITEPQGLSPDMSPDPIVKLAPTPGNFLSRITITQVVLFCTFSSMIGLMLATFYVVLNSGAVRLAGID